jgi:hypothetical protein
MAVLNKDALLVVRIGLTPELRRLATGAVVQTHLLRAKVVLAAVPRVGLGVNQLVLVAPRRLELHRDVARVRVAKIVEGQHDVRNREVRVNDELNLTARVIRPLERRGQVQQLRHLARHRDVE